MHVARKLGVVVALAILTGCSTTQDIILAKQAQTKSISSVAQVAAENNSGQMDGNLEAALTKEGIILRGKFPAGTTTAKDVDALISYTDTWKWDLVMYLKNLTVRVNDAASGDLIAIAQWSESKFHQFRGDIGVKTVMEKLVSDLLAKIRTQAAPAR